MIGKTVSHYKIISKLGEGGMGVVYKAEDTRLDRHVAIKFLPAQLSTDDKAKKRFVREAKAASALNHANIAVVHEIDETPEGQTFMVMACYEGQTLKDRLKDGALPAEDAVRIVLQIASGLAKAHEKGILHRDIKPANILIGDDGQAKLADFGLATLAGRTKITKTGTTVGTVAYMSPEQARGEELDPASDVFSLGVVLYELVTGRTPFPGDHEAAVLYGIMHSDAPPLNTHSVDIPGELQAVVDMALEKEAAERFGSASELEDALRELQASGSGFQRGSRGYRRRRGRSRTLRMVGIGALTLVVATVVAILLLQPRTATSIESIAVLPLKDMSPDPTEEYFTDGMTEALILNLSKIHGLRVTSRTSVMTFKESNEPLRSIAQMLGVDGVIEGSIVCIGDHIQITAQLIDASSDATLWGDTFESDVQDILGLQKRVARAVARGIELRLSPQEEVALAEAPAIDPEVHAAYLEGRFIWNQRNPKSFPRCVELFQEATRKEPGFADGWAALAEAYTVLPSYARVSVLEALPKARESAANALEIDSTSAAAWNVLADVAYVYDLDWEESEKLRKQALLLDPSYATARQWYAEFLSAMGRHDEALSEIHVAQRLDPLSLIMSGVEGQILIYARRYEEAIDVLTRIVERDESFQHALWYLASAYYNMGDYGRGVEWELQAMEASGEPITQIQAVKTAFAESGKEGRDLARLDYLKASSDYIKPRQLAQAYTSLGRKDEAFYWLDRSYEERDIVLLRLKVNPSFDDLRNDPRFETLMKRLRLDE